MSLAARLSRSGLDWIVPDWDVAAAVQGFVTTRSGGTQAAQGCAAASAIDLGPAHPERVDAAARAAILASRHFVAAFLPSPPVWLEQVHGRDVAVIDERTLDASRATPPVADAVVTRLPGVPLSIRVADCLPVLFADATGSVVGAAHAGWRGLAAGVLEATVVAMDVPADAIVAWIGPGIGPRAFEVRDDVRDAFVVHDRGTRGALRAAHARGRGWPTCRRSRDDDWRPSASRGSAAAVSARTPMPRASTRFVATAPRAASGRSCGGRLRSGRAAQVIMQLGFMSRPTPAAHCRPR